MPNTLPKILSDRKEAYTNREIILQALEIHETKIKGFIRVSLAKMKIFHSTEELEERTAEVFQQTAVQTWEKAENFDANRSAYSWLNGFAAKLLMQMRSRVLNRRKNFEDGFEDFERIEKLRRKIEATPLPEEQLYEKLEREDERRQFEERISPLKPDYQKILRLHYFEELEINEIAPCLGKSEGAAQRQLNRAENRLREILGGKRETK